MKAKLGGCFPRGDTAHGNDKSQTRKCNVNLSKFDHVKGESSAWYNAKLNPENAKAICVWIFI